MVKGALLLRHTLASDSIIGYARYWRHDTMKIYAKIYATAPAPLRQHYEAAITPLRRLAATIRRRLIDTLLPRYAITRYAADDGYHTPPYAVAGYARLADAG